jgi:16S rRNA (cytidine1402-2'-O)-methyltransferase
MLEAAALYVVATPIGNLRDITLRALDVLKAVDVVAAEDTRVARQLLAHYGIGTRVMALHEHIEARVAAQVCALLAEGKAVALVSDAGTPAISDPGALLVRRAAEAGFRIVPVPGPSALTAAVSAAGSGCSQFLFYGFLPAQPGARRKALEQLAPLPWDLVFYEAPHRVRETVADLAALLGGERGMVVARELTKLFETIHRCTLAQAGPWLDADPNRLKGEFVLVVDGRREGPEDAAAEAGARALRILLDQLPLKQAVKLAAELTGAKRNALYQLALELKQND